MSDKPPQKCRKCGGRLDKIFSAPAIRFKGSGWYVTDYGNRGQNASKTEGDSASTEAKKPDKTDRTSKDVSPAKKTSEKTSSTKAPSGD